MKKTYLFANQHPTAWLVFSWWDWSNKMRGFWAWWEDGRFILRHLIKKYWNKEWIDIYNKYNQALLEVKDSWMIWENEAWVPKRIWCIVLYQSNWEDDNKIQLEQCWQQFS